MTRSTRRNRPRPGGMLSREIVEPHLGKTFADSLDAPFVVFFRRTWTRRNVVDNLNLANMLAVVRLARVLERLRIQTPAQLASVDPMSLYRVKGVGSTQVFVAMSLLACFGYDPLSWWDAFIPTRTAQQRKEAL